MWRLPEFLPSLRTSVNGRLIRIVGPYVQASPDFGHGAMANVCPG